MNYLLIGGSGFIGTNLTHHLLQEEHNVTIIDKHIPQIVDGSVTFYRDNLMNGELIDCYVEQSDVIVYLASNSHVRSSQKDVNVELGNIKTFINFLEHVKDYDKTIFLASSGGHVYGDGGSEPLPEYHCLQPISPYGIGKATMESFLKYYSNTYSFDYIMGRISNCYGWYQNPEAGVGLITTLLYNHHTKQHTRVVNHPERLIRDYIYVTDVVNAITHLTSKGYTGTFNIGSNGGVSVEDIIYKIQDVLGVELDVSIGGFGTDDLSKIVLDTTKLESTGWMPELTLTDGILLTNEYVEGITSSMLS